MHFWFPILMPNIFEIGVTEFIFWKTNNMLALYVWIVNYEWIVNGKLRMVNGEWRIVNHGLWIYKFYSEKHYSDMYLATFPCCAVCVTDPCTLHTAWYIEQLILNFCDCSRMNYSFLFDLWTSIDEGKSWDAFSRRCLRAYL